MSLCSHACTSRPRFACSPVSYPFKGLLAVQTVWRLREVFKVLIKFQRNEEALGYGQANAVGVGLSEGKYIAFINNDM